MANTAKKINETVSEETAPMQLVKNESAEASSQAEAQIQKPEPQPELSLEERISRVEDLSMLIEKLRKLQESFRGLQTFKIGTDGMSTQIVLRDVTSGREFKTSNTPVVARVLDEIRLTLQVKIAEVESQIKF